MTLHGKHEVRLQEGYAPEHYDIQDRIREAAETLRGTPDAEMRYLQAGNRICMPAIVRGYWEAYGMEPARRPRIPPSAAAIDRMSEVFDWLVWLGKQMPREMKAVWLCFGMGLESVRAARQMACTRRTVQRLRKSGIERLAQHLDARRGCRILSHQITS